MGGKTSDARSDNGLVARLGIAGLTVLGVLVAVIGLALVLNVWREQVWLGLVGLSLGVFSVVLAHRGRPGLATACVAAGAIACFICFAQWVSGWR